MDILSLGNKIKLKRKEKNMKLKDLAGDRITPGQISLIETGKSNPSEDLLKYIAEKLDTTIEYLQESETKQAEDVCRFYADIVETSLECENYLRAEENIEKGLHYANEYNVELYQGIFYYLKSKLAVFREDYIKAQRYAISALIIFLKIPNDYQVVITFLLLGEIAYKDKKYNLAYNYFKEAETNFLNSNIVDKMLRIKIYYNIARCLSKLSKHKKAVDYALMVEKEVKLIEDHKVYADTLMILAIAFSENMEKEEALKYASFAKEICFQNRDLACLADVEESIGEFLIKSLNMEDGLSHLTRALEIKRSIKGEDAEGTMLKIIKGHIKCSKFDKALRLIEILEENDECAIELKIKIFEFRYRIYKELNEESNIEKQILNIISLLDFLEDEEKLLYYYMLVGNFYKEVGEDEFSLKFFQKAFKLKEEEYSI